jgi:hypothetical protein
VAPLTRCYEAATIAATSVGLILGTVGGYMAPERVRPRGETNAPPVKLG